MDSLDLAEGEEEEEEWRPHPNPCDALTNLTREGSALGIVVDRFATAGRAVGRIATAVRSLSVAPTPKEFAVTVTGVDVRRGESNFVLRTKARYPGCTLELTIGGHLARTFKDFEWLRGQLVDAYPGCVVPPVADAEPKALERFLSLCLEHTELNSSKRLAAFCVADEQQLRDAKSNDEKKSPTLIRLGAVILDVVGDATPVDLGGTTAAAKRREADVRELYAWARDQLAAVTTCEKECAEGVRALRAFETADKKIKATLAAKFGGEDDENDGAPEPASGPTRALAALREMVGLAGALCQAVEGRDKVRLQLVAARNALELQKASDTARRAMLDAAESQIRVADNFNTRAETPVENDDVNAFHHSVPPSQVELDGPIETEETATMRAMAVVQAWRSLLRQRTEQLALDHGIDRRRLVESARAKAATLASLGLRVTSKVTLSAAAISADENSIQRAADLVAQLQVDFKQADDRLSADAPKLKKTWDDLQLQAFESFAIGEQNRADLARAAADGAALKLAAAKAKRSHAEDEPAAPEPSPEPAPEPAPAPVEGSNPPFEAVSTDDATA